MKTVTFAAALAAVLSAGKADARPAHEVVVAGETLRVCGDRLRAELDAFLRRLEQTAGLPPQSLRGRGFVDPVEALAYARRARPAYAILPVHQFLQARKPLGLVVLGRAVGLDGPEPAYWGVARRGTVKYEHIEARPGLRLGGVDLDDLRWLSNVIFETNVRAEKHFKLQPAKTSGDALAVLAAGQADVVLLYETEYRRHKERLAPGGDLEQAYASVPLPPPPLVGIGKGDPAERRKIGMAMPKVCVGDAVEICARLGILRLDAGGASAYDNVIEKYAY